MGADGEWGTCSVPAAKPLMGCSVSKVRHAGCKVRCWGLGWTLPRGRTGLVSSLPQWPDMDTFEFSTPCSAGYARLETVFNCDFRFPHCEQDRIRQG